MAFSDEYDFSMLINETEIVVIEELERRLGENGYDDVCTCQDCILDMVSYALNHLQPVYRSTLRGAIYAQQLHTGEYREKVRITILEAITKIHENPSHD